MYSGRNKEELMCDSKEESLSWRKSKPADKEAEGPILDRAEILMRLEKKGRNVSVRDRERYWFG